MLQQNLRALHPCNDAVSRKGCNTANGFSNSPNFMPVNGNEKGLGVFGSCQTYGTPAAAHNISSWYVMYPGEFFKDLQRIGQKTSAANMIRVAGKWETPRITDLP